MLLLDERIRADGTHVRTYAQLTADRVRIYDEPHGEDAADGELSVVALERVMLRYGRELEADVEVNGDSLELPGAKLRRLRFHAVVDATGRDYLVWERPGQAPLAVVATMATAALRYLVLRLGAETPQESEGPAR